MIRIPRLLVNMMSLEVRSSIPTPPLPLLSNAVNYLWNSHFAGLSTEFEGDDAYVEPDKPPGAMPSKLEHSMDILPSVNCAC